MHLTDIPFETTDWNGVEATAHAGKYLPRESVQRCSLSISPWRTTPEFHI
jgi:hypothetical protein